ncbi:MAG: hypothetical protein F6K40_20780 [Okeania sp. SIO3I5]|uniref:hypothetical protein n=1 Tax=Okeania sp. SIO3I5 TaxID=2607805 RepID=UPI0013B72C01|nr:hypothetical protein [Okeania sp. SIO3I5]NEQ38570.1 hypothetical protein [Okeania sp. SIO3I5]
MMKINSILRYFFVGLIATVLAIFFNPNIQANVSNNSMVLGTPSIAVYPDSKDIDYMTNLALMKGHLLVGEELIVAKEAKQAEPHFGHPVEELYIDIENELNARGVNQFKNTLNNLHDLVKAGAKDTNKFNSMYQQTVQEIDGAISNLSNQERQKPEFVLQVINGLLDTAGAEYEAAILDGKIVEVIEYQDSRGFVDYAEILYKNIADKMGSKYSDIDGKIQANMTELKKAWPSALAPEKVAMEPAKVSKLIEQIKQNSEKVG